MGKLVVSISTSLDGYVNDDNGDFDFSEPSDELHGFVNDRMRGIGTLLCGRRLYETLAFWETGGHEPFQPAPMREFAALWHGMDKVVYSRMLELPPTPRTRVEREFDPEAVRQLVADSPTDTEIGGPGLAAAAFAAGLVDEVRQFVCPVILGGGTRLLPDGLRLDLELVDEHRFAEGVVYLAHAVRR
jgi:dihydrofolate reductase